MLTKLLTALLALGYLANGLRMLWAPAGWYDSIPGVSDSGPMNPHFIRDVGFCYVLASGAAIGALWQWVRAAPWLIASAAWPSLHAAFHLAEWAVHGLPAGAAFVAEAFGVVVPAAVGLMLAVRVTRQSSR